MDTISSLWIGDRLSEMEQMAVVSFLKQGHPFELYTYNELANVPLGTSIKDANSILPQSDIFYNHGGGLSSFSDLFRYELLSKYSTWWVDMDVICLKPFVFCKENVFGIQGKYKDQSWVNGAVLKLEKHHASAMFNLGKQKCKDMGIQNLCWADTGPFLLTKYVKQNKLESFAEEKKTFYPIEYVKYKRIFNGFLNTNAIVDSHAVHLWHEFSKNYPSVKENSIYGVLKKRLLYPVKSFGPKSCRNT